jgi:hypothetical protein
MGERSDAGLPEDLNDGGVGVLEERREGGFCYPGGLGYILFTLGGEVGGIRVQHVIPPGVLEVPKAVTEIHVVRDADKTPQFKLVHAGFFLDLTDSAYFNILTGLLMPFGEVPEAVTGYEKEVSAAVTHKSTGGIHFLELCTKAPISLFLIIGRNVYAGKRVLDLEHPYKMMDIQLFPNVELHGIRIRQSLLLRGADYNCALSKVDFMHILLSLRSYKDTNL